MRFLSCRLRVRHLFLAISATCALSTGCGGGPAPVELVDVSGMVTKGSVPVADAMVELIPEAKDTGASYATTGPDGTFILRYIDGRTGASPGKHRVVITTGGGAAMGTGGDEPPPKTAPAPPVQYRALTMVSVDAPVLTFDVSSM